MLTNRDEEILRRWAHGESGSVIAEALGTTKNVIMGKIYRLRSAGHVVETRALLKVKRRPKKDHAVAKETMTAVKPIAVPGMDAKVARTENKVSRILAMGAAPLTSDIGCRFIEGDDFVARIHTGENIYCGKRREGLSSYCAAHHSKCWVTPRDQ